MSTASWSAATFCVTVGSPSRKWIATLVSSRNATVRGLRAREALRRRALRWTAALATLPNARSSRGWRSRRGKQSAHLPTELGRVYICHLKRSFLNERPREALRDQPTGSHIQDSQSSRSPACHGDRSHLDDRQVEPADGGSRCTECRR
jgi:hypothetical protein